MKKWLLGGYLFSILLSLYVIVGSLYIPKSYETSKDAEIEQANNAMIIKKNNIIRQEENIIYINYSKLNEFLKDVNNFIKYNDDIKNIYEQIIEDYYKNNNVKMYDENDLAILEFDYNKNNVTSEFKNYLKNYSNIIVKVLFNNKSEIENIDLDSLNYKINREQVIRNNIVKLAQEQVGNTGEIYWTWYGYNHRVEWCCVFVSWLAYKNDVLYTHIPKFIWVKKGVDYYREKNQLQFPKKYTPKPGDIIFFNWNDNDVIDHVGIVERVENGYVYSIEGNVKYMWVKRRKLKLTSKYIYAYGTPDYSK